ncbi:hypothetical protein GCM10027061_21200 [Nesterenkonia suensis]
MSERSATEDETDTIRACATTVNMRVSDEVFNEWLNRVMAEVWDACNDAVAYWAGAELPDKLNPYRKWRTDDE